MKSKVASFFRVLAALVIGASLVPALVSPAPAAAGNQAWTDLSDPAAVNTGAIVSVSFAKDGLTGFLVQSVGTGGSSSSYIRKTTNGGVSWSAVGLFDPGNANRPTGLTATTSFTEATSRVIVKASPNYATDATVIVAVHEFDDNNDAAITDNINQVYWSKDGGATFTQLGGDILATASLMDIVVSDNFSGVTFTKDTLLVLTADEEDGVGGLLYRMRGSASSPSWSQWSAVTGDYYAGAFFPGSSEELMVIAASDDAATDNAIAEFRISIAEVSAVANLDAYATVGAGAANFTKTPFSTAVTQPAGNNDHTVRASIAVPENWSQATASDREVIAIRTAADAGQVARRSTNTTITTLTNTEGAAADGYTFVAMSGNSTTGFALLGNDDGGVLRSTNGGATWSTIAKGITDEIDGTAGLTAVAVVSSSAWVGNGGNRGGLWKSTNRGSAWTGAGAYSDDLDDEYRDIQRTSAGTWFLVGQDNASANESVFKATSTKAFYRVNRHADVTMVRPSPNFDTDNTVYLGVTTGTTGQVLKSTDGGETFASSNTDPDQVGTTDKGLALAELVVLDKDTVVAALGSGLVALSTDGGATWTHSTSNPSAAFVSIRVAPDGTTLLGIIGTRVVYTSTNKGITWSQKGAAAGSAGTGFDVAFDPAYATNSYIYAAVANGTSAVHRLKVSAATTSTAWDAIGNDLNANIAGNQNDGYRLGFDANGSLWVATFDDATARVATDDNGDGDMADFGEGAVAADDESYANTRASFVASTFDPKEANVAWRTVPNTMTTGSIGVGANTGAAVTPGTGSVRPMLIYGTTPTIVVVSDEGANNDMNTLSDTAAAPVALTPADKSSGVPRATALQWSAVPDATTYDVRLGLTTDPIGTGAGAYNATDQTGVETTNQYGGDGMIVGGTFYWKVREQAPLTSPWSPVWSFKVGEAGVAGVDPNPTPAGGLAAFAGSYETAWRFDNATQSWKVYDPAAPAAVNTLTTLVKDSPFVLVAKSAGAFTYGSRTYTVVKGVNFLSWLGN